MKKNLIIYIIVTIVLIAGSFYGGMIYGKSQNFDPKNFQARNFNMQGAGVRNTNRGNGGFANGEIISQDDKSVTVKLRDGSSKIVLLSDKTKINKSVDGQKIDLANGKQVTVNGTANSDGTITAESVTIVPAINVAAPNQPAPSESAPITNTAK